MVPHVRAGILEFFRATAKSFDVDPDELLRQADVAPEVMTVPGIFLPYANYMKLLDCAARASHAPHFGLAMTRSATTDTLGTTGIIMTQADTVGAAWQALAHFYRIHDNYGTVSLQEAEDCAVVRYGIPRNDLPGTRQIYDVAAGVSTNIMKQFCGASYRALGYGFPYPEPEDLSCYERLGTEQLTFATDAMEMYFDLDLLRRELPGGSDEMRSILDNYFAHGASGAASTVSRRVEDLIRRLLPSGNCTLPLIADTLSVTTRTLQMHLEQEHSSFRLLLEKVRREIATYHLSRGDMRLTQLAMILGYSELSAFSRSFKNWYGLPPKQWAARKLWPAPQR